MDDNSILLSGSLYKLVAPVVGARHEQVLARVDEPHVVVRRLSHHVHHGVAVHHHL